VAPPPVVELDGIEHEFGDFQILRGVELEVGSAASLALFGENGAGKTTLVRMIGGLLRPLRGEARIDGVPVLKAPPALRSRIGFLSHRPLVWGGLTAGENLELMGKLYGLEPGSVERDLERVGLADRADVRARDLSQGQRQRLGIARALAASPDLLLLDEPHAGLDARSSELLDGLIEGLRGRATIIMATHDHERGRRLCNTALTLQAGRLTR
jgi:ABC-type multidrug transport system ATPase subunit